METNKKKKKYPFNIRVLTLLFVKLKYTIFIFSIYLRICIYYNIIQNTFVMS